MLQHGNHQSGSARKKSEHVKCNPLPVTVAAASHSQSDFLGNSSGSRKTTPAEHAHPTNLAAGLGLSVSQKQNQQSTHAHSKQPNLIPSENGQNPFERHSVWSGELTSVCHRMSRLGNRPMHHSTHLAHLPPPRLTDPPLCQAPLRPLSAAFVCQHRACRNFCPLYGHNAPLPAVILGVLKGFPGIPSLKSLSPLTRSSRSAVPVSRERLGSRVVGLACAGCVPQVKKC